jgi:predicted Zn-dependent protease
MSHVTARDPVAQLARRLGMAALAAVLTGGQGETLVQGLLADLVTLRYGREAEDRADSFAVRLLAGSGIDPRSYAAALTRIREAGVKNPGLLRYFDPHSPLDERIASAARAAEAAAVERTGAWEPVAVDWKRLLQALPTVLEPGG